MPARGVRLNYRLDEQARQNCVGHVPFRPQRGDYYDCDRSPEPGKRTCRRCAIVEATFASNLHHAHTRGLAELDPAIRAHLGQPNRLYVAGFRDGSIKVGTSTVARIDRRLAEQGAWRARSVAETTDGLAVRSLEDMVTEVWAIPQAVSARRKINGLVNPVSDQQLDDALRDAAVNVQRLIERAPDDRVVAMGNDADTGVDGESGGPGERWRHPSSGDPAVAKVLEYPLPLISGAHDLEIVTAVGRLLLVRRNAGPDVFVIDPAPLFGLELDIGDYGSGEIAIQDSLF